MDEKQLRELHIRLRNVQTDGLIEGGADRSPGLAMRGHGSTRRCDRPFKIPESVLVVIHTPSVRCC